MRAKKFFKIIDPDTFRVLLDNSNPCSDLLGIRVPDITSWRFCDVMDVIAVAERGTPIEVAVKVLQLHGRVREGKLLNVDSAKVVRFLKHVKNEIEKIGKLQEQLQSEPKPEMINAGVDQLNRFGATTIYYAISNDPNDWDRISELPYYKLFTKMMLDKTHADIQERYNDIMMEKSRHK